jgi:hypothetical protein
MCCIALVRCVLVLRCGSAGVVWYPDAGFTLHPKSVASQLIEEVTGHAQSDSLEDVREICADGTYFPNDLRT